MRCAWLRRFVFSLAGVVCCTGLSSGIELLTPPRPPADNDGLTLDERVRSSPQPVTIEPLSPAGSGDSPVDDDRLAKQEPFLLQPNSSIPFPPPRREPINLPPPDPVPYIEPPLAIYPEGAPPVIYTPACDSAVMPTCANGMPVYCDSPVYQTVESCDSCAADSVCGCSCVPNWTVRAELLIWNRGGGTSVPLVIAPLPLASGDLDSGWSVGPRLTAIKHGIFDSCWDLEVAYFGIDGWGDTRVVAAATGYQTTPVIAFGPADAAVTYGSELQNFELNGRRAYSDWVTWFVGFRAISIDELLTANLGAGTHSVATRNRLYGAQVGLDAMLLDCDYWYFNAVGKIGIYGNSAEQVTTTAGVGGALPLINYTGGDASFVGELGFNANYRLTDRLTFLAGYNLLWVNSLALAPDQLAATNINTGVGALDVGGNLFYHGFNVGLEYGW